MNTTEPLSTQKKDVVLVSTAETPRTQREEEMESKLTRKIIGAAIKVHKELGPGLLESAYEECLCFELSQIGLAIERQRPLPVTYKGMSLDCGYRLDVIVEKSVILELKAVESLLPIHEAQLLTYLKLSGISLELLMNFNVPVMTKGIKRFINTSHRD